MIEVDFINRNQGACELTFPLLSPLRRAHPIPQLRFTGDVVAVRLVASTDRRMKRFFDLIHPSGTTTGLETRSMEVIRIPYTLGVPLL